MPSTEDSGVRIHFDVVGAGRPLLLLHGGAASGEIWHWTGYVDALSPEFQLILIDARGHGRSGALADATVTTPRESAADCIAVLDELGLPAASALGFSMGGSTAVALAALHPTRIRAAVGIDNDVTEIGFDDCTVAMPDDWALPATIEREGLAPIIEALEAEGRPRWAELFRQADPQALLRYFRSGWRPEHLGIRLADVSVPILLVLSEDQAGKNPSLPPNVKTVVIPGVDHVGTLETTDVVLPAVRDFLKALP
jgi:3-oxoadipate enol-lactonase